MLLRRVAVWSAFLLALGGIVVATPKPLTLQLVQNVMGQPRRNSDGQSFVQELDLTRQQQQQLQAIQQQYAEPLQQKRQKLLQAQQELSELMAGTASQQQIRDKYREVNALRQQKGELHFESMLAMREIMTPQQRRRFAQMQQQKESRTHRRDEKRGI